MISTHLPILQVVIPLMAAPLCIIVRHRNLVWGMALAISWLSLFIAAVLLQQVSAEGTISYEIGGWPPPWGINYRIDAASAYVLFIVAAIGAVVMTYAKPSVAAEIAGDRIYLFYTCFLLSLTGLLGMTITGDAFNLFVFLEISSLSSYVLISLGRDKRALTASYRYLILGTIGATFYVIGLGLMYVMTG
ncbi:MAG: proton-conducting transporter membrane subunit, partial [Rhodospirillales bacterium]|nr:proton-conducting transporter membrane subunit [Rhodospirillales bacterium]